MPPKSVGRGGFDTGALASENVLKYAQPPPNGVRAAARVAARAADKRIHRYLRENSFVDCFRCRKDVIKPKRVLLIYATIWSLRNYLRVIFHFVDGPKRSGRPAFHIRPGVVARRRSVRRFDAAGVA
ncbi:hypothetical protein EVAR_74968_1 [Eumeta japonica]|uniref:Uncharacterized protein n=1 Tax=Eumeta variegata TaxID=151549 RepID=A0A4C1UIF2_EUMVA|nr:hypothetical protein EVAR_74968_1 [Eumeta japonica]